MVRFPCLVVVVALLAAPVGADTASDKRACADGKLDKEKRLAACARLIDGKGLSPAERAWALLQRGDIRERSGEHAAALVDYDKALALDPGDPEAHVSRGVSKFNLSKYADAEAAFSKAVELNAREAHPFYLRARARVLLKKHADALEDYGRALLLDPRHRSAYSGRARLHVRMENPAKAIADCDGALAMRRYDAGAYAVRGSANEALGKRAEAIHDYAMAVSLDPNLDGPERGLGRLVNAVDPASLGSAPVAYEAPKAGMSVTYLYTMRPLVVKSEADAFMEELLGWFKKKRVPVPSRKDTILRSVVSEDAGVVTAKAERPFARRSPDAPPRKPIRYYRSIWPDTMPGGPVGTLSIRMETGPIDALWPLDAGTQAAGGGALEFVCPDPLTEKEQFLGCKKPGERLPMGTLGWKGSVTGRAQVIVPAGVFETIVIRAVEELDMQMFGRSRKSSSTVTWWYAPSVRWWVKRTREVEGRLITDEAATIR